MMDFFNSLWTDPEQTQVPSPVNFAADLTAEKWISHSSTYKLISGTFKHPQSWLGIDRYFLKGNKTQVKEAQDFKSTRPNPACNKKEKKIRTDNANQPFNKGDKTEEGCESDAESSHEPFFHKKYGYVPGLKTNPVLHKLSCLDIKEQAECLSLYQKFSELSGNVIMPSDRAEHFKFEVMYKKVQEEQQEFCQDALSKWPEKVKGTHDVPDQYKHILQIFWMLKANNTLEHYPHFYKRRLMVPLCSGDMKVEMVKLSDLLQMGKIPVFFKIPHTRRIKPNTSLRKMIQVTDYHFKPDQVVGSLHKLPVSLDPNAESLARLHKAQIVISSGALTTLAETYFNFSKKWILPISVKEYRTIDKGKTTTKTIVFIDKPLPKHSMTAEECRRFVVKHGLKTTLLNRQSELCFTFAIPGVDPLPKEGGTVLDESLEDDNAEDADSESGLSAPEKNEKEMVENHQMGANLKEESSDDSEDEKMVIEESPVDETNKETDREKLSVTEAPCCSESEEPNVTGAPFKAHQPFNRKDGLKIPKTPEGYTAPLSNTNVTYSSWVIRPANMEQTSVHQKKVLKELCVIVRCRVDGCERVDGDVTAFSLSSKLEYQLEFAAEEVTKEELVREWVSLNFKPAFHVLRVRVDHTNDEIIMFEKKDKSQIVADAQRMHGIRLSDSLQTLYSVFSEVSTLTKGSYLLHHSPEENAFASLEQCIEDVQENKSIRNLEKYFGQKFSVACDPNPAWRKLDCSLLLPRHEVLKLMPATYRPKACGKAFYARDIQSLKANRDGQKSQDFPPKMKKKNCHKKNKRKREKKQNQKKNEESC